MIYDLLVITRMKFNLAAKGLEMTQSPILFATDFSPRADRAIDRAIMLGEQLGREVIGVHVPNVHEPDWFDDGQMAKAARSVLPKDIDDLQFVYPMGIAPTAIAKTADEYKAEILVIGVARYNSINDHFLGTAVDYVLRNIHQPVLVVKSRARKPYCRIVVPTDLSEISKAAITKGLRLFPEADIHLVHAFHVAYAGWNKDKYVEDELRVTAQRKLDDFVEALGLEDEARSHVTSAVVKANPIKATISAVVEHEADLVLFGSHGESGFKQAMIGSTASDLLRSVPTDCLVVKCS